jgi:hypothetical protein
MFNPAAMTSPTMITPPGSNDCRRLILGSSPDRTVLDLLTEPGNIPIGPLYERSQALASVLTQEWQGTKRAGGIRQVRRQQRHRARQNLADQLYCTGRGRLPAQHGFEGRFGRVSVRESVNESTCWAKVTDDLSDLIYGQWCVYDAELAHEVGSERVRGARTVRPDRVLRSADSRRDSAGFFSRITPQLRLP